MHTVTQVGTPERRGAGWFVPSEAVGYFVERVEGRWRCCCPSYRWKQAHKCKHITAVRRMLRQDTGVESQDR
jgi:hypothetical protein